MDRFTLVDNNTSKKEYWCRSVNENKAIQKLGQLEDLEEDIEFDLATLLKAKVIYWRVKYRDTNEYSEIFTSYKVVFDITNSKLIVFESEYDEYGYDLKFSDFGTLWSLKKQDLKSLPLDELEKIKTGDMITFDDHYWNGIITEKVKEVACRCGFDKNGHLVEGYDDYVITETDTEVGYGEIIKIEKGELK